MFSKGFILSLGLSLCAVVLVYLYVKNRITNIENKVDRLIEIIQQHQRMSQQQIGGSHQYEKIVVSEDESGDEEDSSSDEENDEEEVEVVNETLVLENNVVEDGTDIKEEVEQQMLELTSNEEVLQEMEELTPEDDGLDDMDDLEENLDDDENNNELDYSKMGKVQLKEICEVKGFDVKGKKKHELLQLLK